MVSATSDSLLSTKAFFADTVLKGQAVAKRAIAAPDMVYGTAPTDLVVHGVAVNGTSSRRQKLRIVKFVALRENLATPAKETTPATHIRSNVKLKGVKLKSFAPRLCSSPMFHVSCFMFHVMCHVSCFMFHDWCAETIHILRSTYGNEATNIFKHHMHAKTAATRAVLRDGSNQYMRIRSPTRCRVGANFAGCVPAPGRALSDKGGLLCCGGVARAHLVSHLRRPLTLSLLPYATVRTHALIVTKSTLRVTFGRGIN